MLKEVRNGAKCRICGPDSVWSTLYESLHTGSVWVVCVGRFRAARVDGFGMHLYPTSRAVLCACAPQLSIDIGSEVRTQNQLLDDMVSRAS
eukprot:31344-Eustigmatos_ZCMA.PRE.1